MRQISTKYNPPFFGLMKSQALSIMKPFLTFAVLPIVLLLVIPNESISKESFAQTDASNNNRVLDNLLSNSTPNTQSEPAFLNMTHAENKPTIRASSSANYTVGAGMGAQTTAPNQTPANITATINSVMSPKSLLSSAIDQIRNSTSKGSRGNQTALSSATINVNTGVMQLANQDIPAKDFLLVYFGDGKSITSGNVYAKLPCDNKSQSVLQILVNNKPNPLLPIGGLSRPGSTCMYNVDLSKSENGSQAALGAINNTSAQVRPNSTVQHSSNLTRTAIELFNPTARPVVLPSTSSIAVSLQLVYDNGLGKGH